MPLAGFPNWPISQEIRRRREISSIQAKMRRDAVMTALAENHKRALLSRLRRIDNLLREIEYRTLPDGIESAFEEEISGWTVAKRRIVFDWIAEVRELLNSIIERRGLAAAPSAASAAWLIQTRVDLMLNVVDELRPDRMRGYGELSGEACQELEDIISDLRRQFLKLTDTICQGPKKRLESF
jgi:hypothetical protein